MKSPRVIELFAGIGGCAASLVETAEVAAAVDIQVSARRVYELNFAHSYQVRTIEALSGDWFRQQEADLWWMSPPCQPFTRRGRQRDVDDPRCAALLHVIEQLRAIRPPYIALENVPAFADSRAHARLVKTLRSTGYAFRELQLCPTAFGFPMRRLRYYLVASRREPPRQIRWTKASHRIQDFLRPDPPAELRVPDAVVDQYRSAMRIVRVDDPGAVTNCFTSAYGRSHVRSGSFLEDGAYLRRFSPREILALLGFPAQYRLPDVLTMQQAYKLVGNSVSVPVVRSVLATLLDE